MRGIQKSRLSWIPLLLCTRLGVCLSVQRDSIGLRSLTYEKQNSLFGIYLAIIVIIVYCDSAVFVWSEIVGLHALIRQLQRLARLRPVKACSKIWVVFIGMR